MSASSLNSRVLGNAAIFRSQAGQYVARVFVAEAVVTAVMRRQSQQVGGSRAFEKAIGNHVVATVWAPAAANVADRRRNSRFDFVGSARAW
jgi:hypothetical protein